MSPPCGPGSSTATRRYAQSVACPNPSGGEPPRHRQAQAAEVRPFWGRISGRSQQHAGEYKRGRGERGASDHKSRADADNPGLAGASGGRDPGILGPRPVLLVAFSSLRRRAAGAIDVGTGRLWSECLSDRWDVAACRIVGVWRQ